MMQKTLEKMDLDEFHIKYEKERLWETTTWLGMQCWKYPSDIWIIQELIWKTQPEVIIETGTGHGGSALFYASICEFMGYGKVVTVDVAHVSLPKMIDHRLDKIVRKRIKFLKGDSIATYPSVHKECLRMDRRMVILDSWHSKDHVLKEMELYSELVSLHSYMIVEDTHANGHPVEWEYGEGPAEAVKEFLSKRDDFVVDKNCERLGLSFNMGGYLMRVR